MEVEQAEAINAAIRTIAIKHRTLAAAALGRLGLHPGHEAVLLALDTYGPQTQTQLADRAGCEPPSITAWFRSCRPRGLLHRRPVPGNARAIIVELTEQGRAIISHIKDLWVKLATDAVAAIPDPDLNHLTATLAALAESLEQARLR